MTHASFIQRFDVPPAAQAHLDAFFTPEEIHFVEHMDKAVFTCDDVARTLACTTAQAQQFLQRAYRRGVVSLEDEQAGTYRIGDFYGRLDIFSISETDRWRALPESVRTPLEHWYFDAYMDSLDPDTSKAPTPDEVLTLDETLRFIDTQDRPVYLNYCDCRSLAGNCDKPRKVCITYKSGPNTFCHRGLSEHISKEQAKDVVRAADKAGLMHTVNPNGICNCCSDCCYLFRGQQRRHSTGIWPRAHHVVAIDHDACIGCGKCVKRCHFGVFERNGRTITIHPETCVGCGICATACPTHALTMKDRA